MKLSSCFFRISSIAHYHRIKNVGQGLCSIHRLLIGCRDVGTAFKSEDECKISGAGFKLTKWLEKSCIRHQKEVSRLHQKIQF